jgi:CheY-like chemotaxis protein/HPt (histidine-containing phosphotransfer) domain-containing protein
VKSAPGAGSVFTFTVRCALAEIGAGRARKVDRIVLEQRFSGRVLVVEDNQVNRKVARATLKGFGLEVLEAENGSDALDAVYRERLDLIIMDMNMPILDGLEATRRIRAAEAAGRLPGRRPIIGMTANVLDEAVEACRGAGMDDFLPKPFQRAQIVNALAKWLEPAAAIGKPPDRVPQPPVAGAIDLTLYRRVEETMAGEMPLLISDFMSSTLELIENIGRAALDNDGAKVKRCAHTLRSGAAVLGAITLSSMSEDLEQRAAALQPAALQAAAVALAAEFERVRQALEPLSDAVSR